MTIYWCDPYLESSSHGNGTTDTSSKLGTYAAPISIDDLIFTSNQNPTINGTALSDGDEIRIKGLPFSTLFDLTGNMYTGSGGLYLHAVSGNTHNYTLNQSKSQVFAMPSSVASASLGNWSDPIFFPSYTGYQNSTTISPYGMRHYVEGLQKGFTSTYGNSSVGMPIYRLKDAYDHSFTISGQRRMFTTGSLARQITYSAGWTSTTAQDGWSILVMGATNLYQSLYIGDSYGKSILDCKRLVFIQAGYGSNSTRGSDVFYYHVYTRYNPSVSPFQQEITVAGLFGAGQFYVYNGSRLSVNNFGHYNGRSIYTYDAGSRCTMNVALVGNQIYCYPNSSTSVVEFGDYYSYGYFASNKGGIHFSAANYPTAVLRFNNNSVYHYAQYAYNKFFPLAGWDGTRYHANTEYGTNLQRPFVGKLANWSQSQSNYNAPTLGATSGNGFTFAKNNIKLTGANWWETTLTNGDSNHPINVGSIGLLECSGSNPQTTNPEINILVNDNHPVLTDVERFSMFACESNDYDGKPMLILWANEWPTYGTIIKAHLAWNQTIGGTDVLTIKHNRDAQSSGSQAATLPLELQVPNYTQGTDNLRLRMTVAYQTSNNSNAFSKGVAVRTHFRDSTSTGNTRTKAVTYTGTDTTHTVSSPLTILHTLDNLPASGQQKITSVVVGLNFDFYPVTTYDQYWHLISASIETY